MLLGSLPGEERLAQVAHRVLDRVLRLEAEHALDLVRVDVIGADVVGRRGDDVDRLAVGHLLADHAPHQLGDLHQRQILVADVEGLVLHLVGGRGEEQLDRVAVVLDVQVRTQLRAAEHRDLAGVDRVVGQDVDREIEPLPRRVAAHRRRTEDHAGEARVRVLLQERLAHALVLVVERERHERMVLGDVGLVGHAVDRARRGVDEALHPGLLGREHHRLEGVEVDRGGQILVELEARVVRDAGEIDDGVMARHRRREFGGVADIAVDDAQVRVVSRQELVAEEHDVVHRDLVTARKQLRHETRPAIARTARHQHLVEKPFHVHPLLHSAAKRVVLI